MSSSKHRFLFVKHSPNWNVDRCTRWMAANEKIVDWCYPTDEDPFPDPQAYAGVVVFGGANSANDCTQFDWVRRELRFIEQCLHNNTGFFGICLGAQMLARVLGAQVAPHEKQVREVGFYRVDPIEGQSDFLSRPLTVMQWHNEGFELPEGTYRMATGEDFPNQAYALNERVLGVQFHPEVNSEVLAIWHERNKNRTSRVLSEEQRTVQMRDAHCHDEDITQWVDNFMHRWTGSCEKRRQ